MSIHKVAQAAFALNKVTQIVDPTQCLKQIISEYAEYKKIVEQEKTKRREIERWEKETLERIKAQRDVLIAYLDRSFDERSENFRRLFDLVDLAISSGNNTQLALALNSITDLAKSSPFKELSNLASVRAALDDPDHEWTF